ncbi:MAG TPA: potassium-transporting ATPase subunit KdpA [Nitrososphaeraceae archaeon]|nr:potassium-transporting ATPase subunit KdpA [Nitrososphaeraceae archaeon]
MDPIVQTSILFGGSIGMAIIFGLYIARMISYEMRPLERPLAKVENGFFRLIGIDVNKQMTWKEYLFALVLTDGIVMLFIFGIFLIQGMLPTTTPGLKGLSIDLAFNTAASFITNTNLQHYAGDQQLSVLTQMIAITFTMFVAPASAMAAGFAFIRAFIRKNFGLGNFYVDFTRNILTLLLPVAFVSSLFLMYMGVPQTLNSSVTIGRTLEGHNQTFTIGPVASLESIKELGHNGGGFFGSNSGHPFENPNGFTNIYETFLILIIPLSFPIAYAKLIGRGRGVAILIAMLIGFGVMFAISLTAQSGPKGLETRFGSFGTLLFTISSISTNTGATNSLLSGLSPNAVISLFLGMFVQAIPGAAGTGMMTMIVYVLLTLFIVGLMVGKTPEYMSMKISPKDIKLAVFIFLLHPALILIPTVIAFTTGNAQAVLGSEAQGQKVTPFGYTQALYEYTSAAANNGSDYLGTSANTPFWNWSTGLVMLLGRFLPLGLMLGIAGSFTAKDRKEVIESIKTEGPLFISVLVIMTFLLTALTFFPFIVIGPFSMLWS